MSLRMIRWLMMCSILGLLFINGCNKQPEGFPKLYPCKITVTKGADPIPNASVMLFPAGDSKLDGNVALHATTNESGVADIRTQLNTYNAVGVPEGKYSVVIKSPSGIVHTKSDEELGAMQEAEKTAYLKEIEKKKKSQKDLVPPLFSNQNSTPVVINVSTSGVQQTIDVDKK